LASKESPIKHFLIISGGAFLNLLIGVLTTPIITRLVNPNEYGKLSIFNLYCSIAVMVFCIGLDQALVRFYYKMDTLEYKQAIARKCAGIPLILWAIVATGFVIVLKNKVIEFELGEHIAICFLICVTIQLLSRFSVLVLRLEYHSSKYALVNIAHKVGYVCVALILISYSKMSHLNSLVYATTISAGITLVMSIIGEKKIWLGKTDIHNKEKYVDIREMVSYGMPFILSMGITTVFQGIDKMSLNYYCSYREVGIYSSAMSLINIFAILQSSFNAIWAPMATEHYEKDMKDIAFYQKGNAYITVIMFFTGVLLVFCKDVFAFLLGEKYREAAYILPCLCFNPIMFTISETTVSGINFAKKSYLHVWVALIACFVNIVGNVILVPVLGGRGAAISTGLSYIVYFATRTYFSNKYFKVDFKLKRFAFITMVAFGFALYNTFISFGFGTVLFCLLCLFILFVLYRAEIFEGISTLIAIMRNKLKKSGGRI